MKPYTCLDDFRADFELRLPTPSAPLAAPQHLLLTGASGFLGRYVLLDVLEHTPWRVTCLVRAKSKAAAGEKLLRSMKRAGWPSDALPARVDAVCGDIEAERLGFSPEDYERLVCEVDSVAHGAAQIAWSKPYAMLRETNVFGAREMARFCATGRLKRLVFVSSIATRYSPAVEGPIDENTDMRGVVHRMALGYGQSKTVAESLVEELRTVLAPVTVIRPSFIGAHSVTGVLNDDDFIARLLVTIAAERIAPAMHLWLDAVAVDEVAAVVRACLAEDPAAGAPRRLNLQSPEPPYFGEVVAAMNLFCPGASLMDWESWLVHANRVAKSPRHPLHPLRAFLLGRAAWDKTLRTPDLYDARWQACIDSRASHAWLAGRGLSLTPQDGATLELALAYLASRGRVTMHRRFFAAQSAGEADPHLPAQLCKWATSRLGPTRVTALRASSDTGLVSKVAAWRHGAKYHNSVAALQACDASRTAEVFVKHTPMQETVNLLGAALGRLDSEELAQALHSNMALLDFAHLDAREVFAYEDGPAQRSGVAPYLYGAAQADDEAPVARLALERLPSQSLVVPARWTEPWPVRLASLVGKTLASWQALPTRCVERAVYQGPPGARLLEAEALWRRLARQTQWTLEQWAPVAVPHLHALLERLDGHWVRGAGLRHTFVHNDFNPRNLAREYDETAQLHRLRVFDWQLCTLAPPARDLVEFLCFAADRSRLHEHLPVWLASHREALEDATGQNWAGQTDAQAFAWALDDWALRRLPLYALYHRARPQSFLPEVVRNWWALRDAAQVLCAHSGEQALA
jgi:thioester reductase-like protein